MSTINASAHKQEFVSEKNTEQGVVGLMDLFVIVWRNRWVGLLGGVAVLIFVFVYLFMVAPVYRVKARVSASPEHVAQKLNFIIDSAIVSLRSNSHGFNLSQENGVAASKYSAKDMLNLFSKLANSQEMRRKFLLQDNLVSGISTRSHSELNFKALEEMVGNIRVEWENQDSGIIILLDAGSTSLAAEVVNAYARFVMASASDDIALEVNQRVSLFSDALEVNIEGERHIAKNTRQDTIVRLQDALAVARELKIENFYERNTDLLSVDVSMGLPLYLRGTRALESEIGILKNRKNDDPFILKLREMQESVSELRKLSIESSEISVAIVDEEALLGELIKPRKKIVLYLGGVLAIVMALFVIFIAEFIKIFRQKLSV